jgi:uncharacterized protein (TIGR02246 family)
MEAPMNADFQSPRAAGSTEDLFRRYHAAWEAKDAELIASLHSIDSTFKLHDGTPRIHGREALRDHFAGIFEKFPGFTFREHRALFGEDHWVFEWSMLLDISGPGGRLERASVDLLDVVNLNRAGEVTRKDVYLNGSQAQSLYQRMGMVQA